jgi:membrane-bound ClpP family serine protease
MEPILLIVAFFVHMVAGVFILGYVSRYHKGLWLGTLQEPSGVLFWIVWIALWPLVLILFYLLRLPPPTPEDMDQAAHTLKLTNPHVSIGSIGTASSDLSPCGIVMIDGHRHEARTEEGFIDAGQEVVVKGQEQQTLVVMKRY